MRRWVLRAAPQTTTSQLSPTGQSVPGIVDSVVGRRPHTGVHLGHLINQNSHVIRVPELCAAPRKRCNSNDAISMFEIHVGELRATFLRNHNMRRHKDPTRKTAQAEDNSSPEDPHNPDSRHKHGGTAPDKGHYTRYVALHPIRKGALPTDRVQCPNTQEQTRNWHTEPLTATTSPSTGRRAGNDDPVSAGSGPSPRPRTPRCPRACPQRRYDHPQCRRLGPCR